MPADEVLGMLARAGTAWTTMLIRSFADLVRDYNDRFQDSRRRELRWFAIQRSIDDVIEKAAMAVSPAGKRLSHQRRIPKVVLRAWADSLLECRAEVQRCTTFDALHLLMAKVGSNLHGIGDLAIYDTAARVGAFLRLEPRLVYLHRGTRIGAQALGFCRCDSLSPSELPKPFRRLLADDIENCLCIYMHEIGAIMKGLLAKTVDTDGCCRTPTPRTIVRYVRQARTV